MRILNLTQHPATAEQVVAGVVDLQGGHLLALRALLTFDELPSKADVAAAAIAIAALATSYENINYAMIGGAPFLMSTLENELISWEINPLYAFSARESVEETQADGSVRKVAVFRHLGFVGA